jgi:hypothetical protein
MGSNFIFSRKRPFRAIFVSYSTQCSAPGPILCKPPGLSQNTCRWHFMRFWLIFGPYGPRSRPFTGHLVTFPSRQLLAQTEARMKHFVTRTVPSPRTDRSLRHSTTRVGLRARRVRILFFRENVRFGRFSWAIAHGFRHPGQFFGNLPDCHKILVDDILWGFDWFLGVHVPGLLQVVSSRFLVENYLLKQKPEWHISALERSLLHVPTIF